MIHTPLDESTKIIIRKYSVKNAVDYGKADIGSVIGKIIPFAKGVPVAQLKVEVKAIVDAVNRMDKAALDAEYSQFRKEFEQRAVETAKKTAKPRMQLEGAREGDFIARFSPEPSGYMHIGHAKQSLLSSEFAKIYKGKLYLYFDDTNPEKCSQEYVDAIKRDAAWLGLEFDMEYYASDNIDRIYVYARQLLMGNSAYVCMCDRDEIKSKRFAGIACIHRVQDAAKNLSLFEAMLGGKMEEGAAVVRLKGDMGAQNTVLRDPAMLRIVKKTHYRQKDKYSVWPVYDFNTPILDSINGITDIIRSKEYELRDELSKLILDTLGLRVPRMHLEARLNIKGNETHKRVIRKLISDGVVEGWDDPRLLTIMALRRRGIQPGAIKEFVLRSGMSKTDGVAEMSALLSENKKIIDPVARHFFFVPDPVKLVVSGAGHQKAEMRLHPANELGFRTYVTGDTFYIGREDSISAKQGESIRLKDLVDVVIDEKGKEIHAHKSQSQLQGRVIQWVADGSSTECTVLVPGNLVDDSGKLNKNSLTTIRGYAENAVSALEEGAIVQFERFGYCILDKKDAMQFIFISK